MKDKQGKTLFWILVVLILLILGVILFLGFSFNWWQPYSLEKLNNICSGYCEEKNQESYCNKELLYAYSGGATRVSCFAHALNDRVEFCQNIEC